MLRLIPTWAAEADADNDFREAAANEELRWHRAIICERIEIQSDRGGASVTIAAMPFESLATRNHVSNREIVIGGKVLSLANALRADKRFRSLH